MLPSGRILSNTVTVRRAVTTSNRGTRTRSFVEEPMRASIQPMRSNRQQLYGIETGVTLYTAFFGVDPDLRTNDEIEWGNTLLVCLTTASDEAGKGVAWSIDCKNVNQLSR